MNSRPVAPTQPNHPPRRGPTLLVSVCLVLGMLGVIPASAEPLDAGADQAAAALLTGPDVLLGTIGFRSASADFLGQYVTTGFEDKRLQARPDANPLLFELGLFRAGAGRFKLLAENGRWVSVKLAAKLGDEVAKAGVSQWKYAWSFRVKRPRLADLTSTVKDELIASDVPRRLPVCVKAFKKGAYQGLLSINDSGRLVLDRTGVCGSDTRALFMTDDLPIGTSVKVLRGDPDPLLDPITQVRFVAPDATVTRPAGYTKIAARIAVRNYFTELKLYTTGLKSDVYDEILAVAKLLEAESFEVPGEEPEEVDIAGFIKDYVAGAVSVIPVVGGAVSAGITNAYNVAQIGIALYNNSNLEGPRVVESVTNEVAYSAVEFGDDVNLVFRRTRKNLERLKVSILEDCLTDAACPSDRKLAKWMELEEIESFFPDETEDEHDWAFKAYQLQIYRELLPIRGALYRIAGDLPACHPNNERPRSNEELLTWYREQLAEPQVALVTTVWYPFHNVCHKYIFPTNHEVWRPFRQSFGFGLVGDAVGVHTPLAPRVRKDLFTPIDRADPASRGLGLSRLEVVEWLNKDTIVWDTREWPKYERYYHDPLQAYFYDLAATDPTWMNDPSWANPTQAYWDLAGLLLGGSDPYWTNRDAFSAMWVPTELETTTGRSTADPDILPWRYPRLEYGSCATANTVRSAEPATAASVYFANLADRNVDVRIVNADGSLGSWQTLGMWTDHAAWLAGSGQPQFDTSADYMLHLDTHVGAAYQVKEAGVGWPAGCIGTYTARELPSDSLVDYQVAEIHGDHGILLAPEE